MGAWLLTRYADCSAVLADPKWSSNPAHLAEQPDSQTSTRSRPGSDPDPHVILFIDPPDHTRIRGLIKHLFTRRDVERLEAAGVDAMLVGESLVASDDIGAAIDRLLGR